MILPPIGIRWRFLPFWAEVPQKPVRRDPVPTTGCIAGSRSEQPPAKVTHAGRLKILLTVIQPDDTFEAVERLWEPPKDIARTDNNVP